MDPQEHETLAETHDVEPGPVEASAEPIRRADKSFWWLRTKWLMHQNAAEAVHPLLVELQNARGMPFITVGHVLSLLDSKNPEALVREWIDSTPVGRKGLGASTEALASAENGKACDLPALD